MTRAGWILNWSYARPPLKTIFCKQWSWSAQEMPWPLTLGHRRKHTGMPQGGSHLVNASGGGSGWGLKTMGLTDTAIHWTPMVIPQGNFGFLAMEGLEADVVMKCIWEHLQVYLLVNWERRPILMYRSYIFSYLHREVFKCPKCIYSSYH